MDKDEKNCLQNDSVDKENESSLNVSQIEEEQIVETDKSVSVDESAVPKENSQIEADEVPEKTDEPNSDMIADKEESTDTKDGKPTNKVLKKIVIAIVAALVLIGAIILFGNQIVKIEASYSQAGGTKEGTVLDVNNKGISVVGVKRFGGEKELTPGEWQIEEPVTLKKDELSSVVISYKKKTTTLEVQCTDSAVADFDAVYSGETTAGTVIDSNSKFKVTAKYKNGTVNTNYTDWKVVKPVTLEVDSSVEVEIKAEDVTKKYTIKCSTMTPESLSASYDGNVSAGTVLDENNKGIRVTATYKDGSNGEIKDFKIQEKKTLEKGATSTIIIEYLGKTCELSVKASDKNYFRSTFSEIMEAFNSNNEYGMKIYRDEKNNDWGGRCYTYGGKKVSYFINLNSGKDYNADIFFSDENTGINRTSDISTSENDAICVIKIDVYDNTTDKYDSSMAAVTLKLGQKIAKEAGIDFDPDKMAKDGSKYAFSNSISIDYKKDGCKYSLDGQKETGTRKRYRYTFEIELVNSTSNSNTTSNSYGTGGHFDMPGN